MRIDIHIHHADPTLERTLGQFITAFETFRSQIMAKIEELTTAVNDEKTVEDSAIALLQGLSAQLTAALASNTPDTAVQAVIDSINSNKAALAAAVTANTPAA